MTNSLDDVVEIPHQFEIDLNCLVILNHTFTLQSIDRAEQIDRDNLQEDFADEDIEVIGSALSQCERFYEDLRRAARNMAVVGLVTRLDHWIEKYIQQEKIPKRNQNNKRQKYSKDNEEPQSKLIRQLGDLNSYLGTDSVPIAFFEGLVNARDSVIHADSKAE